MCAGQPEGSGSLQWWGAIREVLQAGHTIELLAIEPLHCRAGGERVFVSHCAVTLDSRWGVGHGGGGPWFSHGLGGVGGRSGSDGLRRLSQAGYKQHVLALANTFSPPVALSLYSQIFGFPAFLSCFNTPIEPKCVATSGSETPGGSPETYMVSVSGTSNDIESALYAMTAAGGRSARLFSDQLCQ